MAAGATPERVQVIAHRGASGAHPPGNTIEAFEAAAGLGADGVELDVRRTADRALAVHHDAHLPDGRAIVEVDAAELPAWVPLLPEVLDTCRALHVNVEIKSDPSEPDWDGDHWVADEVVRLLAGRAPATALVTSFDLGAVDRVRSLDPELPTGLLVFDLEEWPDAPEQAAARGHNALNPWDPFVTVDLVERCHRLGLVVNPWTVDDPVRLLELVDLDVDGIITNTPDLLRRLLG